MRHYAHNIGDYAAATRHLTILEDGVYRRMLDRYYQDEKPLPADEGLVATLVGARTPPERRAVTKVLKYFFTSRDDGFHQSRADREITVYKEKVGVARANGTKGGRPSVRKDNQRKTDPVSPSEPNKKLTTPHSPLTSKEEESPPSHTPHERARVRGSRDDPGIEEFEPEGDQAPDPATVKPFLRRHVQQQPIPPGWQPSTAALQRARAARPDLSDEQINYRTGEFLSWCAETNKTTFSPEDTWLNFVRKTDVSKSPSQGDEFDDPGTRAIAAAVARRYPNG